MGTISVFTDNQKLNSQSQGKEFGPVNNEEFRVTSIHSATQDVPVYAVADGTLRFQEDTNNSNFLNCVLKPNNQAIFKNVPVKYFIYRGIKKNSLVDSNGNIQLATNNDLTDKLHNDINPANGNSNAPTSDALGLQFTETANEPYKIEDEELIENLFFENTDSKPVDVKVGESIGTFDKDSIGFEVVLEHFHLPPTMKKLRDPDIKNGGNTIDLSGMSGAEKKAHREELLSYMDPAAFYGLFYHNDGWFLFDTKEVTIINQNGNPEDVSEDTLYNQFLSKFVNKNKIYLDIRNENGLSFNYYENYTGQIRLNADNTQSIGTPEDYATNDWPLKIFDKSRFNTSNGDKKTYIELSLPEDNNNKRLVFLEHAPLAENKQFLFFNRYPTYQEEEKRFENLAIDSNSQNSNYTNPITLSCYNHEDSGSPGTFYPVAFYLKIHYIKQHDHTAYPKELTTNSYLDNLFQVKDFTELEKWVNQNQTNYWLSSHIKYVDARAYIGMETMVKTGVAIEKFSGGDERITFFAIPMIGRKSETKKNVQGSSFTNTFFKSYNKGLPGSGHLSMIKKELKESSSNIETLRYYNEFSQENNPDYDEFTFLGVTMTRSEYQNFTGAISSNFNLNLHPVFLQLENSQPKVDNEGSFYIQSSFQLAGYDASGQVNHYSSQDMKNLEFYASEGLIFNTLNAASKENAFVETQILDFTFGHDPESGSTEYNKFFELRQALLNVKEFSPEQYNKMIEYIRTGKLVERPLFKKTSGGTMYHDGFNEELVQFVIELKYGSTSNNSAGVTSPTLLNVEIQNRTNDTSRSDDHILGLTNNSLNEYDSLQSTYDESEPTKISDNFTPVFEVYARDSNGNFSNQNLNYSTDYSKLGGRAAIDKTIVIVLSENEIRNNYPDEPYKQNGIEVSNSYTKREVHLSSTLAHELGHAEYVIKEPLLRYAWVDLLEDFIENNPNAYNWEFPNKNKDPDPGGHLKGNPTGNMACRRGLIFDNNFIVNEINGILYRNAKDKGFTSGYIEIKDYTQTDQGYCRFNLDN